jgi:hypothetical protein
MINGSRPIISSFHCYSYFDLEDFYLFNYLKKNTGCFEIDECYMSVFQNLIDCFTFYLDKFIPYHFVPVALYCCEENLSLCC